MGPSSTDNLAALLRRTTMDDHQEVLDATNAALKTSRSNIDAQHIKAVALLKLDRYDEVLQLLEGGDAELKKRAALEHSYALYKVGRWADAERLARESPSGRASRHVQAQAAYRLEQFQHAADVFRALASQSAEVQNEEVDLRINSRATDAQLVWSGMGHLVSTSKLAREDLEAFETTYNAACSSVARGEYSRADILLKRAIDLCNALDWAEEDKKAEILPITAQRLYVQLMLGKSEDAEVLSRELPIEEISDPITRLIAQNNVLICSKEQNPFLSQRLFHSRRPLKKIDSPFGYQEFRLHHNSHVLDLLSLKYPAVANSTLSALAESNPSVSPKVNKMSVLNAAAHTRSQTGKPSLKILLPLLDKRPMDVGLLLTVLQVYSLHKSYGAALYLMQAFMKRLEESGRPNEQDVRFAPGLVGLLVTLLDSQGRKDQARTELKKAAIHWKGRPEASSLLRIAGAELLESGKAEDAAAASELFESLRKQDPDDRVALIGLVAANATTHPERVTSEAQQLTPVSRLIAGINVDALEGAGIPHIQSAESPGVRKRKETEAVEQPPKKRFRKSRLPKNYDPSKPPDPERWLPLRERSTYRPKGRKGKAKAAALTQGGIDAEAGAQQPAGSGDKGGVGASKGKKKKGKGGR